MYCQFPSLPPPHPRVHRPEVVSFRLPLPRPLPHLLIPFVIGIGENRDQLRVSMGAATVFGWAGALSRDAARIAHTLLRFGDFLDDHLMLPVIAEVVVVLEPFDPVADDIAQPNA